MNTLLITTQIVAYGVGIVSASLNVAVFVRRRRAARRRRLAVQLQEAALPGSTVWRRLGPSNHMRNPT